VEQAVGWLVGYDSSKPFESVVRQMYVIRSQGLIISRNYALRIRQSTTDASFRMDSVGRIMRGMTERQQMGPVDSDSSRSRNCYQSNMRAAWGPRMEQRIDAPKN
jgi:hypothetical protein